MTQTASATTFAPESLPHRRQAKERFVATRREWLTPLGFLLTLSLLGLSFYPAALIVLFILVNRWRRDRYDFVLMLTILLGGYGFVTKARTGIFLPDLILPVCLILWMIYRKPPLLRKILVLLLIYFAGLFVFAMFSIESMTIQFLTIRNYMAIAYIILPVVVFSGHDFDLKLFFKKTIIYSLIISAFYIIDAFIFSGNILLPGTHTYEPRLSYFYSPIWYPASGMWFRKYPPGLFILSLAIYPLARYYKISVWQWFVIIIGVVASQTTTVISALFLGYLALRVKPATIFRYIFLTVLGCVAIYYIDGMLPVKKNEVGVESKLRIKSTVDQFISLADMVDQEDLAMFASGRMAQILPKFELIAKEHKQAVGLGFLHREKTKINRYIIENEFYSDISQAEEVATGVEVVPAQIYINIGYLGLLMHIIVFVLLYWYLRRLRDSIYVANVMFIIFWMSLGGFAGLAAWDGLMLVSISIGAVLLSNKDDIWPRRRLHNTDHLFNRMIIR